MEGLCLHSRRGLRAQIHRPGHGLSVPLAALAVLAGACARPGGNPNILLVLVDTLRADHLSGYGTVRATSPAADALAAQGICFTRAYAPAPWTLPAAASILTGLYPTGHGARTTRNRLPRQVTTLAEVLHKHGYATAAVVSHAFLGSEYHIDQGFEFFNEEQAQGPDHVSTDGVTAEAVRELRRLAGGRRPFFLLVHYFDPHNTYVRHPRIGFASAPAGRLEGGESLQELRAVQADMTVREHALVEDVYDEEIRYTDSGLRRLLSTLREVGAHDRTLIVFTADHGEEFLEHGRLGHGRSFFDEVIRVPLIVKPVSPRILRRLVTRPVSTVSIAPTLLDLAGLESATLPFQAPSLAVLLEGSSPLVEPRAYSEVEYDALFRKRALVEGQYKLIWDMVSGETRLYDLLGDPGETADLAGVDTERAAAMLEQLQRSARTLRPIARQAPVHLSERTRERLKALGYAN